VLWNKLVVIYCEGGRTGEEEMVLMFGKVLWHDIFIVGMRKTMKN
jgi:hypothetical protein